MTTKSKAKDEEKEEGEGASGEGESSDDKGSEGGGGDGAGGGDLESHIRKVVGEALDGLLGNRDPAPKTGPAQDENAIFRMVKEAQQSLKKEEERDSSFKAVAETVESLKAAVERPPARNGLGGKLQRFMWGDDGS